MTRRASYVLEPFAVTQHPKARYPSPMTPFSSLLIFDVHQYAAGGPSHWGTPVWTYIWKFVWHASLCHISMASEIFLRRLRSELSI